MPRITVEAVHANGEPRRWTLSERIVADNLASDYYAEHLIERLSWATADAEAIESRSSEVEMINDWPAGETTGARARAGQVPA